MRDHKSLKFKIILYSVVMSVILFIMVIVYLMINQNMYDQYNAAIKDYSKLNSFYSELDAAHANFKNYLYTDQPEDFKVYEEHIEQAKEVVEFFDSEENTAKWRFELLHNMEEQYVNQVVIVKKATTNFEYEYTVLLNYFELIKGTSGTYYEQLTNELMTQSKAIEKKQEITKAVSMLISALLIMYLIGFAYVIIRSFTKPLDKILHNIIKIKEGEYDLREVSGASSEMKTLCEALQDMATIVKYNLEYEKEKTRLENRLLEQENENLKKDELLVQSELKTLQNQVNPHFLFNTMTMIYKCAYNEKAWITSEMIEKLCDVFRYSLDKGNKISDIKSEIEAVNNFIFLQRKRFGNRINFIVEIEDKLPNVRIPGMILQPLIENSVQHGLAKTLRGGEVLTKLFLQEEELIVSVSDNGLGMDSKRLEELILNTLYEKDKHQNKGLYNVSKRLKMYFGDHVKIYFNSFEDCGFEVSFHIKYEGDETYV